MKRHKKQEIKRLETVCRMAERRALYGLYITYGVQSVIHRTIDPNNLDAMMISASFYPYITLEKTNGEKESHPITIGN